MNLPIGKAEAHEVYFWVYTQECITPSESIETPKFLTQVDLLKLESQSWNRKLTLITYHFQTVKVVEYHLLISLLYCDKSKI